MNRIQQYAVCKKGNILNLVDKDAAATRSGIVTLSKESPSYLLPEIQQQLILPAHHDVRAKDVDLKRLGAMLWLTHEKSLPILKSY